MTSISSRPSEFKYFFRNQELNAVEQTVDSQTNLKEIQRLAQDHIRQNNIRDAKNIKVLKNGTVQILGDRNNPLYSFSISTSKTILEKAFSPVKSLVASHIQDPNNQEQVLKETSAHIPAEPASSTRGFGDSRFRQNDPHRDEPFGSRPAAEERLGSRRSLDEMGQSSLRDFSDGRPRSSSRFPSFPERAEEMDAVEQLREELGRLTLENRDLQAQLRAKEVPRPAEDTAALKTTLFATRKEKYDLEILNNNQKAAELEQFLSHLEAYKLALKEREDTVDMFSKSSIALSDYFSEEIKEEKAFIDKIIEKENKPKTWAQTGISFLSFGTMGARGDADRIADVDDQMKAVKKQLEALNQRNTLLTNLKEVIDPDLLQIREECDQAETEITVLQEQRDSLIKQLGGESSNIKDNNYALENLTSFKEPKHIRACTDALSKLQAEVKKLKDLVKNLKSATENEAEFKSIREAASKNQEALSYKLKNPKTYQKLPSDIQRLTNGDVKSYNTYLQASLEKLKKHNQELENALEALTALEATDSPLTAL